MSYNTLGRVPSLAALTTLVDLALESTDLYALPPALAACTNLSILNLSRNRIADLTGFGVLPLLVELNISMNALQALPDSLGNSFELQTLVASNNKIKEIPSSLWKCKKVRRAL